MPRSQRVEFLGITFDALDPKRALAMLRDFYAPWLSRAAA